MAKTKAKMGRLVGLLKSIRIKGTRIDGTPFLLEIRSALKGGESVDGAFACRTNREPHYLGSLPEVTAIAALTMAALLTGLGDSETKALLRDATRILKRGITSSKQLRKDATALLLKHGLT